ncbi:MAG TPA: SIMPL domain-containing protein [Acidimicrobiales bacterium]|nr:SIMPL domain-containing protein [Acidimicrobiales bacterium]
MGDADQTPLVRVQGTATTRTRPDRADLSLRVTQVDRDAKEALRIASERADEVAGVLREAGIADSAWHTSGVRVAEEWRWERNKSVSYGFRATATFEITITDDLDVANTIVSKAVAAGAEVTGQDLVVSPDNAGRQDAYRRAALDAKVRAAAYAEALGLELGTVRRIDEISEPRPAPMPRMMAMAAPMAAADAEAAPFPVHVGEVEIDATVTVTFALE